VGDDLGGGDPVFVDRSGVRRRLVTIAGAGLGTALAVGCLALVAGLTGSSPVPLPGFPDSGQGQHAPENAVVLPAAVPTAGPVTSAVRRPPSPRAVVTGATTPVVAPSLPSPAQPGNRRTSHPGNPKPSRTK
jgi:hypothetical protein